MSAKYKAFMSYSQSHRVFATALQVGLQRFGRPWHTQTGLRIFRDNTNLSATPDLWVDIQKALAEAEYLLLLASPLSANSRWVNQELAFWMNHRDASRILILLLEGEIVWDDQAGGFKLPETTALPAVMRHTFNAIPLYVDFRGMKPNEWQLSHPRFCDAVATVSSALHGKSKDELYGLQVSALIVSDARRLSAEAELAARDGFPYRSLLLAATALEMTERHGEPRVPSAESALRTVLNQVGGRPLGPGGRIVAFSSDSRWVVVTAEADVSKVWELAATGPQTDPVPIYHSGPVVRAKFISDNRRLLTVSQEVREGEAAPIIFRLWDVSSRFSRFVDLERPENQTIRYFALSTDGSYLAASIEEGGECYVWKLTDAEATEGLRPFLRLEGHTGRITDLAFSLDSSTLVTGGSDGTTRIWKLLDKSPTAFRVLAMESAVSAVALTSDNRLCVTATGDRPLRLWKLDHEDAKQECIDLSKIEDRVDSVEFSPNGRWLLVITKSYTILVDLGGDNPADALYEVPAFGGCVSRYAFSLDGHWLVTVAGLSNYEELRIALEPEYTVRLWDLTASNPTRTGRQLKGHRDLVLDVGITRDSGSVITCSADGTIRLWDISELGYFARLRTMLDQDNGPLADLLLRDLGPRLGIESADRATALIALKAFLLDHETKAAAKLLDEGEMVFWAADGLVGKIAISPDDRWLVTTSGPGEAPESRLWRMEDKAMGTSPVRLSRDAGVDNLAMTQAFATSPDGRWLFLLGSSQLWKFSSSPGELLSPVHKWVEWSFATPFARFSARGEWLLMGGENRLMLCDLRGGKPSNELKVFKVGGETIRNTIFSDDDRWLIVASGSQSSPNASELRVWSVSAIEAKEAGRVVLETPAGLGPLLMSKDGCRLLAWEKEVGHLWDLAQPEPDAQSRRLLGHQGVVRVAAISPCGRWVISGAEDGCLLKWDLNQGAGSDAPLVLAQHASPLQTLLVDWHRQLFLGGGSGGFAGLWKYSAHSASADLMSLCGHTGNVTLARFSTDGRFLATADDSSVRLWDLATLECRASVPRQERDRVVRQRAEFTSDGKWLVVSKAWEIFLIRLQENGMASAPIKLRGHEYDRISFVISNDNHWLITADLSWEPPRGSQARTNCRVWDLWAENPGDSSVKLPHLPLGVDRIAISVDDRWLITSSADGVRLWPLGISNLINAAMLTVGRELTEEEHRRYDLVKDGVEGID